MAKMDEATRKRVRAGRMLLAGKTPAQAAHAVGVARQTAYTWKAVLDEGGIDALRAMPTRTSGATGRAAVAGAGAWRCCKATDHGFGTELWTLKRVGVLIERLYGVKFGQTQIWRILGAWASGRKSPSAAPSSATRTRCRPGSARLGLGSKKSPPRGTADRLHRRVGPERAAHAGAHLGAQGPDADHPVPLQLDPHLGHRRADAHELHVPAARGQHQERAARRVPQGAARAPEAPAADHLGWPQAHTAASSCASTWTPPRAKFRWRSCRRTRPT